MGLGKTLQAIALGILKKEIFSFEKVLVVTLASLKEQWRREIERFSSEKATVATESAYGMQYHLSHRAPLIGSRCSIRGAFRKGTGQKVAATADDGRMVQLDNKTGEVTLKFKLPGF
jgi:hypothetical protein